MSKTENSKKKTESSFSMIFSEHTKIEEGKAERSMNTLLIGASGSGKSYKFIRPNILSGNGNMVITDPGGELYDECAGRLEETGYSVMTFNTQYPEKSSVSYNPLSYVKDTIGYCPHGLFDMADTIVKSGSDGDPFWHVAERQLLLMAFAAAWTCYPKEQQSLSLVAELVKKAEVPEGEETSELDDILKSVSRRNRWISDLCRAARMTPLTRERMVTDLMIKTAPFLLPDIKQLTDKDTIALDKYDDGKNVLFIITPTADATLDPLADMLCSQLMWELMTKAEESDEKTLSHHTVFYLDEAANIGAIPELCERLPVMRKYGINTVISLQTIGQLKALYPDEWHTISESCDIKVYMGGSDRDTEKWLSRMVLIPAAGSRKPSDLSDDECIVCVRGCEPVYDSKYTGRADKDSIMALSKKGWDKKDIPSQEDNPDGPGLKSLSGINDPLPAAMQNGKKEDVLSYIKKSIAEDDNKKKEAEDRLYPGEGLMASKKDYTVNEALKLIRIKEERIEQYKEKIKKTGFAYVPADAEDKGTDPKAIKDKTKQIDDLIHMISHEQDEIADIKHQIKEYDAAAVPESMKTWGYTIETLKEKLPGMKAEKELLFDLACATDDEEYELKPDDKGGSHPYKKKTLYDTKDICSDYYALVMKIAYWEESIEEAYTADEVISIGGEAWI